MSGFIVVLERKVLKRCVMRQIINTEGMNWDNINALRAFTANTDENKERKMKKIPLIIWGAIQLTENVLRALKQLNAYDAASIIKSEATWLQKHGFNEYRGEDNKKINIETGRVYYLDFGKTYKGELPYFHYGLCVGKKEGKVLVIPITSADSYRETCYHPVKNPKASKKMRQALMQEGFSKDCVLIMNDAKFISAGRIIGMDNKIQTEALENIQSILFSILFPDIRREYDNVKKEICMKDKKILCQQEFIEKLQYENDALRNAVLE